MQRTQGLLHTHDQEPHGFGDSGLSFDTISVRNSSEITQNHLQPPFSHPNQSSYLDQHRQQLQQSDQRAEENQSYSMDDFFEHVLSMPSWSEDGSMAAKSNWDINSLDPLDQTAPKLFKAALIPLLNDHDPLEEAHGHLMTAQRPEHDQAEGNADPHTGDGLQFHGGMHTPSSILANQTSLEPENAVSGLLSLLRMPEDAITASLSLQPNTLFSVAPGTAESVPMPGSAGIIRARRSMGSSESEGSARAQHPSIEYLQPSPLPTAAVHSRQQPYVGASLPLSQAQTQPETLMNVQVVEELTNEAVAAFGKRYRSGEGQAPAAAHDHASPAPQEFQGTIFTPYGGAKANQMQPSRLLGQQTHKQSGQGSPVQAFGVQGPSVIHPQTVNAHTGASRPRIRARRGQATDPHSIAERLRRERIADRMKWLQELVPNANKTDKASMLDEIIDYVKFLQLQVKVLSMSRMGSAGVMSPFVSDLPSEAENAGSFGTCDKLISRSNGGSATSQDVLTEREVARLMEVDMGSAMQFLQSKGLCLMPISLATAMSSKGLKSSSLAFQPPEKCRTEPSIASTVSTHSGPASSSAAASPGGSGSQCGGAIKLKPSAGFSDNAIDRSISTEATQTSRSSPATDITVVPQNNDDERRSFY